MASDGERCPRVQSIHTAQHRSNSIAQTTFCCKTSPRQETSARGRGGGVREDRQEGEGYINMAVL